ncbi:hypothetical protein OPT61_g8259 [Boeremia exigua]|uniref:Uncharacterized protein n=1 Tax=Boeremia exigua TaxID=749465 RepID=A0ACC2HZJ9_9PLEO|nr:hypothetical protein OPT61_g8259 [Boeremia exigua]
MPRQILTLDQITNYGAQTNGEYASLMVNRSKKAQRSEHGRYCLFTDEDGFEAFWNKHHELTIRDGDRWVSIVSPDKGGLQLVRGSSFDEELRERNNRNSASRINPLDSPAMRRKAQREANRAARASRAVSMIEQGTQTEVVKTRTTTAEKWTQTCMSLDELRRFRDKKKNDAESLAQKLPQGLERACHLKEESEQRSDLIVRLIRASAKPDSIPVQRIALQRDDLDQQLREQLQQLQHWVNKKRTLDDKIARLIRMEK